MTVRTLRGRLRLLAVAVGAALALAAPAFGADAPQGGNTLSLGGKGVSSYPWPHTSTSMKRSCLPS